MKNIIIKMLPLIVGIVLNVYNGFAQDYKCGTIVTEDVAQKILESRKNKTNLLNKSSNANLSMGIRANIIRDISGNGGLTIAQLNTAISQLNARFSTAGITFNKCVTNYINNDNYYNGVTYDLLGNVAVDNNLVNIYFVPKLLPMRPSVSGATVLHHAKEKDFIIIDNDHATNGATVAHEMGHFLSLFHTHEIELFGIESVTRDTSNTCHNCYETGDLLCGTAADPFLFLDSWGFENPNDAVHPEYCTSLIGSRKTTCPGDDYYELPTNNLMSYYHAGCKSIFVKEQIDVMIAFRDSYRDYIYENCSSYPAPTCNDKIQNQGEAEADCGGPCAPCHCFDDIPNNGEIGTDCGGTCPFTCANNGPVIFDCEAGCHNNLILNCGAVSAEEVNDTFVISNAQITNKENTTVYDVRIEYSLIGNGGTEIVLIPLFASSTIIDEILPNETVTAPAPIIYTPDGLNGAYQVRVKLIGTGNSCISTEPLYIGTPTQPSSPSASCFDRIQNQGETETDCGGPYCEPCMSNGCKDPDIAIIGNINRNFEAPNHITAPALNGIATIQANAKTSFDAGKYIDLKPGFTAEYNSRFDAFIDGCGGNSTPKFSSPNTSISLRNYPNPFTGETTIEFNLTNEKQVSLFVTDMMGKKVATLLNNQQQTKGSNIIIFDGSDYPPGIYYFTLQAGDEYETQKMILMR